MGRIFSLSPSFPDCQSQSITICHCEGGVCPKQSPADMVEIASLRSQ